VLAAIERDVNSVREYSVERALRLVTLKLSGTRKRFTRCSPSCDRRSIVLLGGVAKDRPYPRLDHRQHGERRCDRPGAHTRRRAGTIRVNALHPDVVGDSPTWSSRPEALEAIRARTPIGRVVDLADTADAVVFPLENRAVNGVNLMLDGGARLT